LYCDEKKRLDGDSIDDDNNSDKNNSNRNLNALFVLVCPFSLIFIGGSMV